MTKVSLSPYKFLLSALFLCSAGLAAPASSEWHSQTFQDSLAQRFDLDVDGDGDLDYVVHHRGELELWINNGANRWNRQGVLFTSIANPEFRVVDFNHDGYADLVILDHDLKSVPEIWNGAKNGTLRKSEIDFSSSFSATERDETNNAPVNRAPILAQLEGSRRHWKNALLEPHGSFQPVFQLGFVCSSLYFYKKTIQLSHTPPRSPPTSLFE